MKLYTETEIVSFLKREFADEINAETFMENLAPIELPSDEEIEERAGQQWGGYVGETFEIIYSEGAKWMRDKTYGGNK
jgi:hypothetical protein